MTQPVFPASSLTVGLGKEPTYGVTTAPAFWIPVTACAPADTMLPLADAAWRSIPASSAGHTPGPLSGGVKLGGNVHPDSIGFPIVGILGDAAVTGASAPFTTAVALLNSGLQQPRSYTITTTDDVGALAWPGQMFSQVQLVLDVAGALTWTADTTGLAASTATRPTPAFTAVSALPSWLGVVTLGGTVSHAVLSTTVTFTRGGEGKRNVNGSVAPYVTRAGLITVNGTSTVILQSDAIRAGYVAGTPTSIDLNFQQGSGAAAVQVRVHCSRIVLTSAPRMYASGSYVQMSFDWTADMNSTDVGASGGLSPVKVTLQNACPSGTYT